MMAILGYQEKDINARVFVIRVFFFVFFLFRDGNRIPHAEGLFDSFPCFACGYRKIFKKIDHLKKPTLKRAIIMAN